MMNQQMILNKFQKMTKSFNVKESLAVLIRIQQKLQLYFFILSDV